jgi:endonuclease YncB( thermonuclease family)
MFVCRRRGGGGGRLLAACRLAVSVVVCVACVAALAATAQAGRFTLKGSVTAVVDGDTMLVRMSGGKSERVRLIGIDTPERGACWSSQATAAASRFAVGKPVTLRGDATQDTRDRYGRLLAYVWLPGGQDLGYQLIAGGFGKAYVYNRPFSRLSAYQRAETTGKRLVRSLWNCDGTPPQPAPPPRLSPAGCDPNYTGYCVPPYEQGDVDCADIPVTVRVVGSDPHRLDGDNDGYGCE